MDMIAGDFARDYLKPMLQANMPQNIPCADHNLNRLSPFALFRYPKNQVKDHVRLVCVPSL
jgi:hypothetical protein